MGLEPVDSKRRKGNANSNPIPSVARGKKRRGVAGRTKKDGANNNGQNQSENCHAATVSTCATIPLKTLLSYAREGHAVLRSFLPASLLSSIRGDLVAHAAARSLDAWRQKVSVASNNNRRMAESCSSIRQCQNALKGLGIPTNDLPFLQIFNAWRDLPSVEALCTSPRMGHAASRLLGVKGVRLYQDSLFHKRRDDGKTPWHVDARMAPFDSSLMITFWIPLQGVPALEDGGTGLVFVGKSHSDFALPYWNEFGASDEFSRLEERYGEEAVRHHMPMEIGDVTAHSGWTLHCTDANRGNGASDRYALAITYVDARAEIREDVSSTCTRNAGNAHSLSDDEDQSSYASWISDVAPRCQFQHPLLPDVWPHPSSDTIR